MSENPKKDDESKSLDKPMSDEELIKIAKERFNIAVEAESENRKHELDDQRFMIGDQWPSEIRNQRFLDSRPCLTINRLPQFVRQVTNDQRQNRPSIKINPCDSEADIDTAKIFQGMIRHIEYNSHADVAYDTAFEAAAGPGIGYYRLVTDYSDPMSFQQEILIKRIKDRFSVYCDPYYQEPDGSDMDWGFVFDDMSHDEYKIQHPDSKLASMSDWTSFGEGDGLFIKKDMVRVAEYYYKVFESCDICLLSDKRVVKKEDLPDKLPDGLRVVSERKALIPKIKWAKINGLEVLDKTDIPGKWIPIVPVIGEEHLVEGKRILSGIIRNAKDPQRMYNYYASAATEMIALAPKAPWVGAEGQFEGYEEQWGSANTRNHAYLQYKPKSEGGIQVPPPARTQFEPQVQAITNERSQASDELKATTGIYDASLGNRSNEQSGVAIQRRNTQAQVSNFHFTDNLSRALRHTGRILIDWIPKVYDTAQAVRVIGEDGTIKIEQINQIIPGPDGSEIKSHFLDAGTYDCTVDTGPSYQTKRQEAVGSMIDLARAAPQAMANALDIMVRSMDWPGHDEIADRIKRSLPPQITADDKDNQKPLPPQVQQQLQQSGQMIQALSKELEANSEIIRTKRLELESKERIALSEQETQLRIEFMKHHAKDAQITYQTEVARIDQQMKLRGMEQVIGQGPGDQPQMSDPGMQGQPDPQTSNGAGGNAAPPGAMQ